MWQNSKEIHIEIYTKYVYGASKYDIVRSVSFLVIIFDPRVIIERTIIERTIIERNIIDVSIIEASYST